MRAARCGCGSRGCPTTGPSRRRSPIDRPPAVRRPSASLVGALLLGALHGLAFAPVPFPAWLLPFVQIAAFAGLCALTWRAVSVPRATVLGFVFGMGHFGVGISWIYTSLHVYAHMAAPLAVMGVVLLSAYLSIFPAAATAFARWIARAHAVPAGTSAGATAGTPLVFPRAGPPFCPPSPWQRPGRLPNGCAGCCSPAFPGSTRATRMLTGRCTAGLRWSACMASPSWPR
ncbi:hypothetical protein [Pigmentiphaga litoralis]|uniref:hypothetical protein n=1 Tax=Pigmentiphaga litoralis TaxID=516702 RepID=UPI003B43108C